MNRIETWMLFAGTLAYMQQIVFKRNGLSG